MNDACRRGTERRQPRNGVPYTPAVPVHRLLRRPGLPFYRVSASRIAAVACVSAGLALCGCFPTVRSDPTKATRQYPFWLTMGETIDAQVLTDGDTMIIVNATTRSFSNVDVWLNERYMLHVDSIAPGENKRLNLGDFWDIRGEGPNPGGLLRYYQPTPVRLVQIQLDSNQPLVGLKAVLTEAESR